MKNLELDGLHLQELDLNDLVSIVGGGGIWGAIVGWVGGHFADELYGAVKKDFLSRDGSKPYSPSERLRTMGPY